MRRNHLIATLLVPCLSACSMLHSDDPASLAFVIPAGSKLVVKETVPIDNNSTHATIQFGKFIRDRDRQDYEVNCRIDFRDFGPRDIEPESYRITRTEDGNQWISHPTIMRYYTEVHLESDEGTDIIEMVCQQYGSQTDKHFTVAEMQATLGAIVRIAYPATHPATDTATP
jgi:hypothetical protein